LLLLLPRPQAMDEFDVFMDAINRRIATQTLLEFAREKGHLQFIFLTPQVRLLCAFCSNEVCGCALVMVCHATGAAASCMVPLQSIAVHDQGSDVVLWLCCVGVLASKFNFLAPQVRLLCFCVAVCVFGILHCSVLLCMSDGLPRLCSDVE
jgi:hypothetical protein